MTLGQSGRKRREEREGGGRDKKSNRVNVKR
jgi:hypothetical protein